MAIIDIISRHLQSNRRLVVPTLGCFIVKGQSEILFSELLSQDDGVLRGLLVAEGLSEMECAAQIDRFIFEVRHSIESSGRCVLDDFGVLRTGERGELVFERAPQPPRETVIAPSASAERVEPSEPTTAPLAVKPMQSSGRVIKPTTKPVAQPADRVAPTVHATAQQTKPTSEPSEANPQRPRTAPRARRPQPMRRKRGADKFMILALVVLLLALAAIGYGYYCSRLAADFDEQQMDALRYRVEDVGQTMPQN